MRCRKVLRDGSWTCRDHHVELIRTSGGWGTYASRDDMSCPVGEPEKFPEYVIKQRRR